MRKLAIHATAAFATLVVIVAFWQFRNVLVLFLFSLFVAAAIRPVVAKLNEFNIPPALAQIGLYLLVAILGITFFYFTSSAILRETSQLIEALREQYQEFYFSYLGGTEAQQSLVRRLPSPAAFYEVAAEDQDATMQTLIGLTQSLASITAGIVLVVVLSIYWSADQALSERLILSLLPAERRITARQVWRDIEEAIGGYLRSRFLQSILIAAVLGITYWLVGMPFPILLMLAAAVGKLIPLAGSFLTIGLVFLAGLTRDFSFALAMAGLTLGMWLLLKFAVEPYVFNEHRFSSLLVVIAAVPFFQAFGILGFILAPPFAVAIQLSISHFFDRLASQRLYSDVQLKDVEARLQGIRTIFEDDENHELYPPEIGSIIQRLNKLIDQAKNVTAAEETEAGFKPVVQNK